MEPMTQAGPGHRDPVPIAYKSLEYAGIPVDRHPVADRGWRRFQGVEDFRRHRGRDFGRLPGAMTGHERVQASGIPCRHIGADRFPRNPDNIGGGRRRISFPDQSHGHQPQAEPGRARFLFESAQILHRISVGVRDFDHSTLLLGEDFAASGVESFEVR